VTCAFLWRTYTCNLNLIHTSKQKLVSGNFFKSDNCQKIIRPWPNSNLTCIILWCIHIPNLNQMCATVQEIMNRNHQWLWSDGMTKGNTICPRPFHGGGIKIWQWHPFICGTHISTLCEPHSYICCPVALTSSKLEYLRWTPTGDGISLFRKAFVTL
jgi:hypothetical protein